MNRYFELVKFEHTLFALPFAYLGLFIGRGGLPGPRLLLLVTLAMVGARTAAMAYNRIADRDLDALNPRTAGRPIPTGRIAVGPALLLFAAASALLVGACALINRPALLLSPVALALVTFYSHTKRFTTLCHLALGVCLAAAPVGGFIAATGTVNLAIFALAGGVLFWTAGFDMIYALLDLDFDRAHGVRSIPAALGARRTLGLALLCHLVALLLFGLAGLLGRFGPFWYAGLSLASLLIGFEHSLARRGDAASIQDAFFKLNALVSTTLFLFGAVDRWLAGGPRG